MTESFEMICFDAGGTLLRPFPSVGEIYSRVARRYGCIVPAESIETRFRELWQKRDSIGSLVSYSDEKIEKDWWRLMVKEVFSHFDPVADFDSFFHELYDLFAGPECWQLYPETLEVLEELRRRKKKMCVISNWDSRLLNLCKQLELEQYFEFILISAVFGFSKPNPKIFQEALKRAGAAPAEALHIGDSLEDDVRGALDAGMSAVFLDRHARGDEHYAHFNNIAVVQDLRGLLQKTR